VSVVGRQNLFISEIARFIARVDRQRVTVRKFTEDRPRFYCVPDAFRVQLSNRIFSHGNFLNRYSLLAANSRARCNENDNAK